MTGGEIKEESETKEERVLLPEKNRKRILK